MYALVWWQIDLVSVRLTLEKIHAAFAGVVKPGDRSAETAAQAAAVVQR